MGRHRPGIDQRSRTPRDRRTVPEERNGPAKRICFSPVFERRATLLFRQCRSTIAPTIGRIREPRSNRNGRLPASLPLPPALLLPSLPLSRSLPEIPFCRGWTTDSSVPRFVCTLPSSSVALPPLWPRLHDYTFAFLGPGIVLLVGRVYQRIILLVLFHVLPHPAEKKKNKRVKPLCVSLSRNAEIATWQHALLPQHGLPKTMA